MLRVGHVLLAAGYLVVWLREDELPPLGIGHPHYSEVRVYSAAPNPETAMERIADWLRNYDGAFRDPGGK